MAAKSFKTVCRLLSVPLNPMVLWDIVNKPEEMFEEFLEECNIMKINPKIEDVKSELKNPMQMLENLLRVILSPMHTALARKRLINILLRESIEITPDSPELYKILEDISISPAGSNMYMENEDGRRLREPLIDYTSHLLYTIYNTIPYRANGVMWILDALLVMNTRSAWQSIDLIVRNEFAELPSDSCVLLTFVRSGGYKCYYVVCRREIRQLKEKAKLASSYSGKYRDWVTRLIGNVYIEPYPPIVVQNTSHHAS